MKTDSVNGESEATTAPEDSVRALRGRVVVLHSALNFYRFALIVLVVCGSIIFYQASNGVREAQRLLDRCVAESAGRR